MSSREQQNLKKSIKSAQWFELFGEVSCLIGSVIFVADAFTVEETPFYSYLFMGKYLLWNGSNFYDNSICKNFVDKKLIVLNHLLDLTQYCARK